MRVRFLVLFTLLVFSFNSAWSQRQRLGFGTSSQAQTRQTESGVFCLTGSCKTPSLRVSPQGQINQGANPANGARRALANLFRTCEAAQPIKSDPSVDPWFTYVADYRTRNSSYSSALAVDNPDEVVQGETVYVPEVKRGTTLRTIGDPRAFIASGPYGAFVGKEKCNPIVNWGGEEINIALTPKIFGYGGNNGYKNNSFYPGYCAKSSRVNQMSRGHSAERCGLIQGSAASISFDCAEAVELAFRSSCLKFTKDSAAEDMKERGTYIHGKQMSTKLLSFLAKDQPAGSCLKEPNVSSQSPFAEGDVLVGPGGHSLIITDVGNDPLGIQKALQRGNCNSIRYEDFNFNVFQSTGAMSIGPSQTSAKHHMRLSSGFVPLSNGQYTRRPLNQFNGSPYNHLRQMAIRLCRSGGQASSSQVLEEYTIARHKKEDPECFHSAETCPQVAGGDCPDQCGLPM